MRNLINASIVIASIVLAIAPLTIAQDDDKPAATEKSVAELQERATEIMRHEVGTWNCRWEYLDQDGNVVGKAEGTEVFKFRIPDRILEIETEVPAQKSKSISLRFFKPDEKLMYFISVDNNGDLWTLTEPVGGSVSISKRHRNPDGSDMFIRFSVVRETENERDVLMESSRDEKVWNKVFYQYMVRKTEPDSSK